MKKIPILLCLLLLLPLISVSAGAYGSSDGTLVITHLNVDPAYYEGAGVIYTTSSDGTLGSYGAFTWWYTVSFQWDETEGCYVVTEVHNTVNSSKNTVTIPENGFCYCVNLGNDYPQLYKDDPTTYQMYSDPALFPDYTSDATDASFAFAASLKNGDKAYLYGTDLNNNVVLTNEIPWYKDGFETKAYISIGSKSAEGTPYSPDGSASIAAEYRLGINALDSESGEGQSVLLTPAWGKDITKDGVYGYDWWKTATFEWSESDNAYVITSLDLLVGSNRDKCSIIPENGFVLAVNLGNNYSASGGIDYTNDIANYVFEKLSLLKIGMKAYLTGIDPAKGSFEYSGDKAKYYDASFVTNGFVNICGEKPKNAYEPEVPGNRLGRIVFKDGNDLFTQSDVEISWEPVDGAESYTVYVCDTTTTVGGNRINSFVTTETSCVTESSQLISGSTYTVFVYASAKGRAASEISSFSFRIASERALESVFRDKKIIAFGDSITEAVGGWVSMLFGELGTDVINAGVGGDTTCNALERIDGEVLAYKPDIVIVNFGMNDQAYDTSSKKNLVPISEYEANYRKVIEKLQASGAKVVLAAVHDVYSGYYSAAGTLDYCTGAIDDYDAVVKKLSEEYKTGFLDINALAQDSLAEVTTSVDGIHLSAYGNRMYCKWISDYLYEYLGTDESELPSQDESLSSAETSLPIIEENTMSTTELVILIVALFAGISVFGVLFIKTVNKNKKH